VASAPQRDEAWAAVVKGILEIARPPAASASPAAADKPAAPVKPAAPTEPATPATPPPERSHAAPPTFGPVPSAPSVTGRTEPSGAHLSAGNLPRSLQASPIFLVIPGLKSMGGPEGRAALETLHRVLRENLLEGPAAVAGLRVLSSLTGAIVIVPDDANEEAVRLFEGFAPRIAAAGVALRAGITHGTVELIQDADGTQNAIGECLNRAARVATAKNNPGLFVELSYADKAAEVLSRKHWLHPARRKGAEAQGKREEKFACFAPPDGAIAILSESTIEPPSGVPPFFNTLLLAYDLPSFSEGDARNLASRFRTIVEEIQRLIGDGTLRATRLLFSPGGDGGVLAIEGAHASQAHRIAEELEMRLDVASWSKASDTAARARIGLHYGRVLLYENAEKITRPTGPALFDADALAGDDAARNHDSIVFSEPLIQVASHGSRKYQAQEFEKIDDLASAQGHPIRRYVRRGSARPQEPKPPAPEPSKPPAPAPAPSPGRVAPAPEHISIGRLPAGGKHFLGREAELGRLDAAWADDGTRVVSIVAMGGAGKSALVDAWLQRLQKDGWRGAERVFGWSFFSQGSSNVASGDTFIAAALEWFGDEDPSAGSAWEKGERLARLVKKHRTLLVLDGLEPLQAPPGPGEGKLRDQGVAALVRELSASGRGLCVISTRLAVDDLAAREAGAAPRIELERLSDEDGARLLEALGVRGSKGEREEAAREMKGHALALTLLGSYLADACGGEVRRRKEIGPLEEDARHGEHAKRVMDAYVRWFGDGPEVAVLKLLGLFDRPADEGCLRALRAEPAIPGLTEPLAGMSELRWNQTVAKLRRAHLVAEALPGEPGTLDAHPLVREHFGARLRAQAPEAWRAGHGRLFEHLQRVAPPLPEDTVAMAPLYAAVVHGCHAERRQEALDEVFWKRVDRGEEFFSSAKLGAFGAELGMLAAFFDPPWRHVAPGLTDAAGAFVLSGAGFALRALGRLDEAAEPMQLGLEKAIAQEDWKNAAAVAGNLSELHLARGAVDAAIASARQAVALAGRSGDAFQRIVGRTTLADSLHHAGQIDEARALFEEAEALQKSRQPTYPLLYSVQGFQFCDLLLDEGQIEDVLDRAGQALEVATHNRWLLDIALDHLSLGRARLLLALRDGTKNFAAARTEIDEAVCGLRQAGAQEFLLRGLLARAELHLAAADLDAAQRDLDEAFAIATRGGMRLFETDAHLGFTRLALARADPATARTHLAAAKALLQRTGYHRRDRDLAELEARLAPSAG
jgi:tetratricopeptide (TPR) repeat protein